MRLEYDNEQEKKLRLTEIQSILENSLYENESIEEMRLVVEEQFLEGDLDGFNQPVAYIRLNTGHTMEIIYDIDREQYLLIFYDVDGDRLEMYNADTVVALLNVGKELQRKYSQKNNSVNHDKN
jgi:hypothetical protein